MKPNYLKKRPSSFDTTFIEPKQAFFNEEGQESLENGQCPYCEADMEGIQFGSSPGSDMRNGGFMFCEFCKISFAWLEDPFECVVQENPTFEKSFNEMIKRSS